MPGGNTRKNTRGTALITGASEGIGYELTRIFATDGYDLVLVARNKEKLNQVKDNLERACGVSVRVIAKDLAKESSPDEIYDELKDASVKVDVLVNNAGYNTFSPIVEMERSTINDMIQVMVWAPTRLTNLFLGDMLRRNNGRIMNVSSIVSFAPSPYSSVYNACKAYLLLFTESIALEVAGSGVSVTVLCPGTTRTQFAPRARMEDKLVVRMYSMSAEDVARIGYRGMMDRKAYVVPGLFNKMLVLAARSAPWSVKSIAGRILVH